MKPATLEFIKQRFSEYYQTGYLIPPPSLEDREWGFIFFDPSFPDIHMCRHIAFVGKRELFDYLKSIVPAHVFHSCAYYISPSAPTMVEKTWTGADLIFDLDADHIARGPYHIMLERVKEETIKLIEMLTDELGFDIRTIEVVFSGGRGYHIHIRDITMRGWGSQERRELIDYVCGIGINPKDLFMPPISPSIGWRQRYINALNSYLDWLHRSNKAEVSNHLSSFDGVSKRSIELFLEKLDEHISMLNEGTLELLLKQRMLRVLLTNTNQEFMKRLKEYAALADEPVTTDTKRLIRMPTSLHGGSGLRVTPLSVRDLQNFDPLIDAVVFGTREIAIEPLSDVTMQLVGNTYIIKKREISNVPEAVAVFLCSRGLAEIAGG